MYDNELFLPNYYFNRSESKAANLINKRGGINFISKHGGDLIGTKSQFETTPLVITSAPKGSAIACTLNNFNEKLFLVCVYNPPSDSPFFIKADKVIDIIEEIFILGKLHDYVLIGGHLNLQDVDWKTLMPKNDHNLY